MATVIKSRASLSERPELNAKDYLTDPQVLNLCHIADGESRCLFIEKGNRARTTATFQMTLIDFLNHGSLDLGDNG